MGQLSALQTRQVCALLTDEVSAILTAAHTLPQVFSWLGSFWHPGGSLLRPFWSSQSKELPPAPTPPPSVQSFSLYPMNLYFPMSFVFFTTLITSRNNHLCLLVSYCHLPTWDCKIHEIDQGHCPHRRVSFILFEWQVIPQITNLCQALTNTNHMRKGTSDFCAPISMHLNHVGWNTQALRLPHQRLTDNTQLSLKTPKGPRLANIRGQIGDFKHKADDCKIKPRGLVAPRMLEVCGAAPKVPGEKRVGTTSRYQQGGLLFQFYILSVA